MICERSYFLKIPEPCDYGGYHEYLTMYTEDEIHKLINDCDILFFSSNEAPSDFSDNMPVEDIILIGKKL